MATASYVRNLTAADLNGDGKADLVTVHDTGGTNIYVMTGKGDGTFNAAAGYASSGSGLYQAVVRDLNGDGKPDLVVPVYGSSYLTTFLNNGDGSFGGRVVYSVSNNPISVAVGDFNGDGRPDVALALYNGAGVGLWTGDPTVALTEDPSGSGVRTGYARGNLWGNSTDTDYFAFTAHAGRHPHARRRDSRSAQQQRPVLLHLRRRRQPGDVHLRVHLGAGLPRRGPDGPSDAERRDVLRAGQHVPRLRVGVPVPRDAGACGGCRRRTTRTPRG